MARDVLLRVWTREWIQDFNCCNAYSDRLDHIPANLVRLLAPLFLREALHVKDLHLLDDRRLATLSGSCSSGQESGDNVAADPPKRSSLMVRLYCFIHWLMSLSRRLLKRRPSSLSRRQLQRSRDMTGHEDTRRWNTSHPQQWLQSPGNTIHLLSGNCTCNRTTTASLLQQLRVKARLEVSQIRQVISARVTT